MAYPSKPTAAYDYESYQSGAPTTPLPADQVQADYAKHKVAIDAIIDFIQTAIRSDGQLNNGIVSADSLATSVLALMGEWNPEGDWTTATAYAVKDWVRSSGSTYVCLVAHTSGTFATDLAAGKWAIVGTSGSNAFTTTSAGFTMPAIGSTVSVSVLDTTWMVAGQMLYVGTAGFMSISSITNSTTVVLTNTGAYGNAAAAASIATAKTVSPAGALGGHWYYGSGAPANTLGADGDYYLRDTGLVYAKASGSWSSTGINLTGPQGDAGDPGAAGQGVPTGGSGGAVLRKVSGTDYDTAFGAVDLADSDAVTGVLPRANGGFTPATVSNILGADVNLASTGTYYDGPSVAQGTSGTWLVFGWITATSGGIANIQAKLWDGTTVVGSGRATVSSANEAVVIALSGVIASPAANLKISGNDATRTDGSIKYNFSGNSKDSALFAIRIG